MVGLGEEKGKRREWYSGKLGGERVKRRWGMLGMGLIVGGGEARGAVSLGRRRRWNEGRGRDVAERWHGRA